MKKFLFAFSVLFLTTITSAFAQDSHAVGDTLKGFNFKEFGIRSLINITAIFILVRLIYFIRHKNRDFLFSYILFNCINFLICYLLSGADLGVGFAFGLFAIFSIMRYRTVTLPVKEMGYLFLSVALALLNSLAPVEDNFIVLIISNAFILFLVLILDRTTTVTLPYDDSKQIEKNTKKIKKILEQLSSGVPQAIPAVQPTENNAKKIIYERIDLIRPEARNEMIEDLRTRTGMPIYDVEIVHIDLMHDVAELKAYYHTEKENGSLAGLNIQTTTS